MTKLIATAIIVTLFMAGSATAQTTPSPGNAAGGATGAVDGPGNTGDAGGPTAGTGGSLDQTQTGSTNSDTRQPPNKCDPAQAAKDNSRPNQNNASAGCVK
ncbi:hypothetical protein [Neorhizobium galegae]|uniref:hypothetical protein n=1 Tax=Neorhizobium galegae TaxID=399 RepID=UPI000622143E|nr:hypothetical protein [Neorhizobium galegae]CDZ46494.1 Hypothetical protein NGAL_HAMBI2427_17070 [Neorhizobium galegae bv. orientalis]